MNVARGVGLTVMSALVVLFWTAGSAVGAEPGWHPNLEAGKKEAKQAGRPILVVTLWPDNL